MKALKDLGEFGFINRISKSASVDSSVVKGIGDDAAVLHYKKDAYLLLSADMLTEGRHFRLKDAKPSQIGWKALCCSISDIAAMGGAPKWATVSLGLRQDLSVNFLDRLYAGINKAAKTFGVNIVGGDTTKSARLTIDVAILAEAKKKHLVLRSGARPGDLIFVTGALGGAVTSGRHLRFTPCLKQAQELVNNFKISSMIDISDGLAGDLKHITDASKAGAVIFEELIPLAKGVRGIKSALTEGEDYQLLFTMSFNEAKKFLKSRYGRKAFFIGQIIGKTGGILLVDKQSKARRLSALGFRHF